MKVLTKLSFACLLITAFTFSATGQTKKYKCLLQMSNYIGEGAYVIVSLVSPQDAYEKTLYVMGADKKWYKSIDEWYKFYAKKPANLSAVTGASVTGGDRSINVIEIENSKINTGYKLRFETAVEGKKYYLKDVEIPLTTAALSMKSEGTGYIRYVRLIPN